MPSTDVFKILNYYRISVIGHGMTSTAYAVDESQPRLLPPSRAEMYWEYSFHANWNNTEEKSPVPHFLLTVVVLTYVCVNLMQWKKGTTLKMYICTYHNVYSYNMYVHSCFEEKI